MPINKDKLEARENVAKNRPEFIRPESWRYKRLETTWRKPKGVDNHQRKQKSRGRPKIVKIGYRGPKEARGLHPSGYTDNLVYNVNDLEKLDPKTIPGLPRLFCFRWWLSIPFGFLQVVSSLLYLQLSGRINSGLFLETFSRASSLS